MRIDSLRETTSRRIEPLILGFVCCALVACYAGHDSESVSVHDEPSTEDLWQRFLATARPGAGNGYVVDGDLYYPSLEALRAAFDEAMEADVEKAHEYKQISTGKIPTFSLSAAKSIKYCVSDSFAAAKSTWVTAMADATKAWEQKVNVRFSYQSGLDSSCNWQQAGVDFAVGRADGINQYCAANKMGWQDTSCPIGGFNTYLGVLSIDTTFDPSVGGQYPNVTPTGALRHELGHILGLRHEHPWRGGNVAGSTCPELPTQSDTTGVQLGTTSYEQASVMHYPFNDPNPPTMEDCGGDPNSDFHITNVDAQDTQRIYGMPPAWLVGASII
jgi:hypothetical protein